MRRRTYGWAAILVLLLAAAACDKGEPAAESTSGTTSTTSAPPAGTVVVHADASVSDQGRSFSCSFIFDPMPADAIVNIVVTGKGVKQPPSLMGTQSWSSKGSTASGETEANEVAIHEYPGELHGRYGCDIEGMTSGPHRASLSGDTSVNLET